MSFFVNPSYLRYWEQYYSLIGHPRTIELLSEEITCVSDRSRFSDVDRASMSAGVSVCRRGERAKGIAIADDVLARIPELYLDDDSFHRLDSIYYLQGRYRHAYRLLAHWRGSASGASGLASWRGIASKPLTTRQVAEWCFPELAKLERRATMVSCTILLLMASGMRRRWRQNCSFKRTGSSAAEMWCW
jgi:hypothetical protein